MVLWTVAFWKAAVERAAKTFAQALVALIGATQISVLELDWGQMLGVAATASVVSVLTSMASAPFGLSGPSLADEKVVDVYDETIKEIVVEKGAVSPQAAPDDVPVPKVYPNPTPELNAPGLDLSALFEAPAKPDDD